MLSAVVVTVFIFCAPALGLSFATYQHTDTRLLVDAIWNTDYATLFQKLDAGADPNEARDALTNSTLLMLAVKTHKTSIAQLLIRYGADVSADDELGNTALYNAAILGDLVMVEALLENGADPNAINSKNCNRAILHSCAQSTSGNRCNHLIMKALILTGADLDTFLDCDGNSVSNYVNQNYNKEFADVYKNFKTTFSPPDSSRNTTWSLVDAVRNGHSDIVEKLLNEGADADAEGGRTRLTALFYAVFKNDTTIAKMLLDHDANPLRTDEAGYPPLYYAVRMGYLEIAQLLLDYGADINGANRVDCGQTPLMGCVKPGVVLENKCDSALATLLIKNGANPDDYDCTGITVKKAAYIAKNEAVLFALDPQTSTSPPRPNTRRKSGRRVNKKLIAKNSTITTSSTQKTPSTPESLARLLLRYLDSESSPRQTKIPFVKTTTSPNPEASFTTTVRNVVLSVTFHPKFGRPGIFLDHPRGISNGPSLISGYESDENAEEGDYVKYTNEDLFDALRTGSIVWLREILASGDVDIGTATDEATNFTALPFTLSGRYPNQAAIVRILLRNKATNLRLNEALYAAINLGSAPVVQLLLQNGADPNELAPDEDNCIITPLIACASNINNCNEVIIRILLKYGANVTAQNCRGQTAFNVAIRRDEKVRQALQLQYGEIVTPRYSSNYIVHALREMYEYRPHDLTISVLEPKGIRFEYARDDPRVVQVIIELRDDTNRKTGFNKVVINAGENLTAPLVFIDNGIQINGNHTFYYQLAAVFADGRKYVRGNMTWTFQAPAKPSEENSNEIVQCGYIAPDYYNQNGSMATIRPLPWNVKLAIRLNSSTDVFFCSAVLISKNKFLASHLCFVDQDTDSVEDIQTIKATLADERSTWIRIKQVDAKFGLTVLETVEANVSLVGPLNYEKVSPACLPNERECAQLQTNGETDFSAVPIVNCYVSGINHDKVISDILASWFKDDDTGVCDALQGDIKSNSLVCSFHQQSEDYYSQGGDELRRQELREINARIAKCLKRTSSPTSKRVFNEICPALTWINSLL